MKKFIQIKNFVKQNKILKFCLGHLKSAMAFILTEIEINHRFPNVTSFTYVSEPFYFSICITFIK